MPVRQFPHDTHNILSQMVEDWIRSGMKGTLRVHVDNAPALIMVPNHQVIRRNRILAALSN